MIVTLLTDFGLSDPYVGVMKGVMLNICPEARLVDISHGIPPQQVDAAAFVLGKSYGYFPDGTIHCVVVDPGVGSERKALIVRAERHVFVAPDNGVLKSIFHAFSKCDVFEVCQKDYFLKKISRTFHGRDIFAPVAAHLAGGVRPESIGVPFDGYIRGEIHEPAVEKDRIVGRIVYFDRFGNAVTNIPEALLRNAKKLRVIAGNYSIDGLASTYNQVKMGDPLAVIGSFGKLEIAIREGSAKEKLFLNLKDEVIVSL